MKFKCDNCGKNNAEWCYMPKAHYLCDECVVPNNPEYKGCSCNWIYLNSDSFHTNDVEKPQLPYGEENIDWKWVEKGVSWQYIDDIGRPFPCCEYEYSKDGWDESTFEIIQRLDDNKDYKEALEIMNNYFNNWLNSGSYDVVNNLIINFVKQDYSLELNINLLLLLFKHRSKLDKAGNGRISLFDHTKKLFKINFPDKSLSDINYLA